MSNLPRTLLTITSTKIAEYQSNREQYQKKYNDTESKISQLFGIDRVWLLVDALSSIECGLSKEKIEEEKLKRVALHTPDVELKNIKKMLWAFSAGDPSISKDNVDAWESALRRKLDLHEAKHQHTTLLSQFVVDWLNEFTNVDSQAESNIEKGREEMREQHKIWESYVFQKPQDLSEKVTKYLETLFFASDDSKDALAHARRKFKTFADSFHLRPVETDQFHQQVVKGILKTDSLSASNTRLLKELSSDKLVLKELTGVFNMKLRNIEQWRWSGPVPVETRRAMNGRYRVFMDEELLDALLLFYIGKSWSAQAYSVLREEFCNSACWKMLNTIESHELAARRIDYFFDQGITPFRNSVIKQRFESYQPYFLSHLCESGGYEETASCPTKDQLLELMIKESLLQTTFSKEFAVFCTDFKWFGPSVNHSAILAILKFFNLPKFWIDIFEEVLKAPMSVKSSVTEPPVSKRRTNGLALNSSIGDFCGELLLFCLDFAVNQNTGGANIYRLHDDVWMWGPPKVCSTAWRTILEFCETMGLALNEDKTGSKVLGERILEFSYIDETDDCVSSHLLPVASDSYELLLPAGNVSWGLLMFDGTTGNFKMNHPKLLQEIEEIRFQLNECDSVMKKIQTWNSYCRFLANKLGAASPLFGVGHIDMLLDVWKTVYELLFPKGQAEYFQELIHTTYNVSKFPRALLYLPFELGGLELRNPMIDLFFARTSATCVTAPVKTLAKGKQSMTRKYDIRREHHLNGGGRSQRNADRGEEFKSEDFMPFAEYVSYTEAISDEIGRVYMEIGSQIEITKNQDQEVSAKVRKAVNGLEKARIYPSPSDADLWNFELFFSEMEQSYGGLSAVDKDNIPLGVMQSLKKNRVRLAN